MQTSSWRQRRNFCAEILVGSQSPQARIAELSLQTVILSSARTTKRFPSPRCASAIQIVRPSRSTAETQPKLHPALLRLSAMISQHFTEGCDRESIVLP